MIMPCRAEARAAPGCRAHDERLIYAVYKDIAFSTMMRSRCRLIYAASPVILVTRCLLSSSLFILFFFCFAAAFTALIFLRERYDADAPRSILMADDAMSGVAADDMTTFTLVAATPCCLDIRVAAARVPAMFMQKRERLCRYA